MTQPPGVPTNAQTEANRFAWIFLLVSLASVFLIPAGWLVVGAINVFVLIYSLVAYRGAWRIINTACCVLVMAAAAFWLFALSIDWAATSV